MIKVINLCKQYDSIYALKNINFALGDKGLVFIHGKSGSGKTTLLNILSGIDTPSSGDIEIKDHSFSKFNEKDLDSYRNSYVGYIFQRQSLLDHLTVKENIKLASDLQGRDISIEPLLAKLELRGLEDRYSKELSYGQLIRVSIARALAKDPLIILADEPTSNLDSVTSKLVYDIFKEISKTKLVIIVSHDEQASIDYADIIINLADGQISSSFERNKEDSLSAFNYQERKDVLKYFRYYEPTSQKYFKMNYSSKKSKYTFRSSLSMSFNILKSRIIKTSLTITLVVFTLFIFSASFLLSTFSFNDFRIRTYEELDTPTLIVEDRRTDVYGNLSKVDYISDSRFDLLNKMNKKEISISAMNYYYSFDTSKTPLNDKVLRHVNQLVFFNQDINEESIGCFFNSELLDGRYPRKDPKNIEFLISDFLADSLIALGLNGTSNLHNYQDIYQYSFTPHNIALQYFKVVGVFKTSYKDIDQTSKKDWHSYLNYEGLSLLSTYEDELLKLDYWSDVYHDFTLDFHFSDFSFPSKLFAISSEPHARTYYHDIDLYPYYIDTHLVQFTEFVDYKIKDKQLIINLGLYIQLLEFSNEHYNTNYTIPTSIEEVKYYPELRFDISNTYSSKFDVGKDNIITDVEVVGVLDFGENLIFADGNMIKALEKLSFESNRKLIYIPTRNLNPSIYEELEDNGFVLLNQISSDLTKIKDLFDSISLILIYSTILLLLLASFILTNYLNSSIKLKTKDIGILRMLGASNKDCSKIFIIQSCLVGLLSLVFSFLLVFNLPSTLNDILTNQLNTNYDIIVLNPTLYLVLLLVTCSITLIATLLPLKRILKLSPIKAIQKEGMD